MKGAVTKSADFQDKQDVEDDEIFNTDSVLRFSTNYKPDFTINNTNFAGKTPVITYEHQDFKGSVTADNEIQIKESGSEDGNRLTEVQNLNSGAFKTASVDSTLNSENSIIKSHWLSVDQSELDLPTSGEADGWHINAVNAWEAWADYSGAGVIISIVDDGWQSYSHPDLDDNIRDDLADPNGENGKSHGQNTTGLIGAEANGSQVIGIAYDSDLSPEIWGTQGIIDAGGYADVMNNSWHFVSIFNNFGRSQVETAVSNGRDGLGTIVVFSAGNSRTDDISANVFGMQSMPETITVAAMDTDYDHTYFSSTGSSLLITAPGIELQTTNGESGVNNYFAGTSGSAPIVSGVVGLMLEANADLGWRDVHQILTLSAGQNNPGDSGWEFNGAQNWNGGGMHFSHDHGFGIVDARAAVRLAETWEGQRTSSNEVSISATRTPNVTIPDNSDAITRTIDMSSEQNLTIESVELTVDINNHGQIGDLDIYLVSPDGTEARILDNMMYGNARQYNSVTQDYNGSTITSLDYTFAAQNFRGEESSGVWTLRIQDTAFNNQGVLADWTLKINGEAVSADDTYFFSDEYADLSGRSTAFTDNDGGTDTLNAVMLTSGITVDLEAGTGTIDGQNITVSGIENIYGGDGNDTVTGDSVANTINTGRGDDVIYASAGSDILYGGAGNDQVIYSLAITHFDVVLLDATTVSLADYAGNLGMDTLYNFETYTFNSVEYTYSDLETYITTGLPEIKIKLENEDWKYVYKTQGLANETLSADSVGYEETVGNVFTVIRTGTTLSLEILDSSVATTVGLRGTDNGETIEISGTDNSMTIDVKGFAGNDTLNFSDLDGRFIVNGGAGEDAVTGGNSDDHLFGGDDADTISGGSGNDYIYGGYQSDILNGNSGDDEILGGQSSDTLNGDEGNDRLEGEHGNDTLNGGAGDDVLIGGEGNDTMEGGDGNDSLYGGSGDKDVALYATDLDNFLLTFVSATEIIVEDVTGSLGTDVLYDMERFNFNGQGYTYAELQDSAVLKHIDEYFVEFSDTGFDYDYRSDIREDVTFTASSLGYSGGSGDVFAFSREENSLTVTYLDGASPPNVKMGGNGSADTLTLNGTYSGADGEINGNGGDDTITVGDDVSGVFLLRGGEGSDTITGSLSGDNIRGGTGDDEISGRDGEDIIWGDEGNDEISGGAGDDQMEGDGGDDTLNGDEGNDRLEGEAGSDTLNGGAGDDILIGGEDNDTLNGDGGNDQIWGQTGDDGLYGNDGFDMLFGGDGNDTLDGGAGDDTLEGGDGDDLLIAGRGRDSLIGGSGSDEYAFTALEDQNNNIFGFSMGEDTLNITDILEGYDSDTHAIEDFVLMIAHNSNRTTFKINADGDAGGDFENLAQIKGADFTGLGVQDLIDNGTLITNQSVIV